MISIKLKDFLGIKDVEIKCDKPLTIIQGENGAGKSSIADGFRLALGAKVRQTMSDDRKRLGRDGNKFAIAVEIGEHKFQATASGVPTKDEVSNVLKVSRKAISFCLDSERLLTAKAKDLKALFSEVLQLDFDWKSVAIERGCNKNALERLPEDMKKATNIAEKNRAGSKVQDLEKPTDPDVIVKTGVVKASQVPLPAMEDALIQVETEVEDLVTRRSVVLDKHLTADQEKAAKAELKKLMSQLKESFDTSKAQADLSKVQKEITTKLSKRSEVTGKQKAIQQVEKKFKEILDLKLSDKSRSLIESKVMQNLGSVDTLENHHVKLIEELNRLEKRQVKLQEDIASSDTSDIKVRVKELEASLKSQISDEEIAKIDAELEVIKTRLEMGRAARDIIRDYHIALSAYEQSVSDNSQAKEEWQAWDEIAKAIPEIEKQSVTSGLTPLMEIVGRQNILSGDIAIDPELNILYDGRSVELMSDSERYRICLVLFFALLELFKFPFALIDRGDLIVSRAAKSQLLKDMAVLSQKMQVIFLQARPEEEIQKPSSEQIGMYVITKGEGRRL